MQDYGKLKVWERAHALALRVYRETQSFPKDEAYGLTAQVRRSASSIPSNIAEGCGRDTQPELLRFLRIAMGSANELEYQLLLARDLAYLTEPAHLELAEAVNEIKRMLAALIVRIRDREA